MPLLLLLLFAVKGVAQEPLYEPARLKRDISYLKTELETNHPNLYIYTPKQEIDRFFDSISTTITKPITELEFYAMLSPICSLVKDGHTIPLPSERITAYHNDHSSFLPLHLTIEDLRLYADMVCNDQTEIKEGDEILMINGLSSAEVINELSRRMPRDGNNQTYPKWILNNYLREYYSYIFGHADKFEIKYKNISGEHTTTMQALPKATIYKIAMQKYADRMAAQIGRNTLSLQFSKQDSCALLKIGDFHNDALHKNYHLDFKKVVGAFFKEIDKQKPKNLVIDLRDNQGGDIVNGVFLLSYLIEKPFKVVESYRVVVSKNGERALKDSGGECLGYHKPNKKLFTGKLYVLVNGGSFSNSGIVSSCLKKYTEAVFIGEETGGNNQVLAGYTKNCVLPETKLRVDVPTRRFQLTTDSIFGGHGTLPDYTVPVKVKSVINKNDDCMDFVLKLMNRN